jgi:hypothetical protein
MALDGNGLVVLRVPGRRLEARRRRCSAETERTERVEGASACHEEHDDHMPCGEGGGLVG